MSAAMALASSSVYATPTRLRKCSCCTLWHAAHTCVEGARHSVVTDNSFNGGVCCCLSGRYVVGQRAHKRGSHTSAGAGTATPDKCTCTLADIAMEITIAFPIKNAIQCQ